MSKKEREREQSCSYIKGSKIEYITFTLNEYEIRAILVKRIGEIILSVVGETLISNLAITLLFRYFIFKDPELVKKYFITCR